MNWKLVCKEKYKGFTVGKEYNIEYRLYSDLNYCIVDDFGDNRYFSIVIDGIQDFVWNYFMSINNYRKLKLNEIESRK